MLHRSTRHENKFVRILMYFLLIVIAYTLYIFLSGPPSGKAPVLEGPKRGELRHDASRFFAATYTVHQGLSA